MFLMQRTTGISQIVINIDAINGEFIQHFGNGIQTIFGQSIGRGETGSGHIAIRVHARLVTAAVVKPLPELPLILLPHFLNPLRTLIHHVCHGAPDEQHARIVDLLNDTLHLTGRRPRFAGSSRTMHLKQGKSQPCRVQNFLMRRVRMLLIPGPGKHSQAAVARVGHPIRCQAESRAKGQFFSGFNKIGLCPFADVDDVLLQHHICSDTVIFSDV